MSIFDQRKACKKYIDDKLKEIKVKYRSQAEIASRFMELIKIIRLSESSLNIDSLTGQKIDSKVTGIIFAEVHIVERIEILSDKMDPK